MIGRDIISRLLGVLIIVTIDGCAMTQHHSDHWFGEDKIAHFFVSSLLGAAATTAAQNNGVSDCDAPIVGVSLTLAVGTGKEFYDKYFKKTYFSWKDMIWNMLGVTAGSLAVSQCH